MTLHQIRRPPPGHALGHPGLPPQLFLRNEPILQHGQLWLGGKERGHAMHGVPSAKARVCAYSYRNAWIGSRFEARLAG